MVRTACLTSYVCSWASCSLLKCVGCCEPIVGQRWRPSHGNYDLGRMTLRPVPNTMVTSLISADQFPDIPPLHDRGQVMRYWPRFLDITRGLDRVILRLMGRGELQPCFVYVPRAPQPAYRSVPTRRA
jgi:hypothetical protein